MNGYYDEFEAMQDNGFDEAFLENEDFQFDEAYTDEEADLIFDDNLENTYSSQGAETEEERRRHTRRPRRPSYVSQQQFQRSLRNLSVQINRLKQAMKTSQKLGSRSAILRKLQQLEKSLSSMQNNQLLESLLGYPKLEEIAFEDQALGTKRVKDNEYQFPILQLLQNAGGKDGNKLFGDNNMLLYLMLQSGSKQDLPLLLLLMNSQNSKK